MSPRIAGPVFIDAYAGTGAVGIEALSRGAARAIFIERSRAAAVVIRDNLRALGIEDRGHIIQGKVLAHLGQQGGDIVFLDPPYDLSREYSAALEMLGLDPPPLVIAQHSARDKLNPTYGSLTRGRELKQGDNMLSFYEPGA